MVKYLSVSEEFWDFRIFHFSTVFVAVDPLPLANKGFAAKPSLIWRRGSQNTHGQFPRARWWLSRSETARIPFLADWPCTDLYRASRELARVGFLYLRFLTIQLQQAHHPPPTPTNFIESPWLAIWMKSCEKWRFRKPESPPFDRAKTVPLKNRYQLVFLAMNVRGWFGHFSSFWDFGVLSRYLFTPIFLI